MTLNPGISFGPEGLYMGANIFELYREKLSLNRDFQHPTCRNVGESSREEGGFGRLREELETVETRLE